MLFRKDHSDQKKEFSLLKIAEDKRGTQAMPFLSIIASSHDIRCMKGCQLGCPDFKNANAKTNMFLKISKGIDIGDNK